MCTYDTQHVALKGSGKGPAGWFSLAEASVYYDHPVHAPYEHTVNVDFLSAGAAGVGPPARVAVELDPTSARELARALLQAASTADAVETVEAVNA
jgi:hypothetical protein